MKLTKRDVAYGNRLDFGSGAAPIFLSEEEMDELRAHLQAERDEELGRWRDPEKLDTVVYQADNEDAVYVFDEREGGASQHWTRRNVVSRDPAYTGYPASYYTADRYFAAHPEPKPWEKARPDEVWVLTISNDREEVFRCGEKGLYSLKTGNPIGSLLSCSHNKITAGHRIWPEGEASE